MSGRGVLFAVDDDELGRLGEAQNDAEVKAIVEALEARWEPGFVCELDKAWDVIHRALTDGRLTFDSGKPPLSKVILGGTRLTESDDLIVTAKGQDEVIAIARALAGWDRAKLRAAYYRIPKSDYGDLDEQDLDYAWAYFEPMREFWIEAARAERAVIFAVEP